MTSRFYQLLCFLWKSMIDIWIFCTFEKSISENKKFIITKKVNFQNRFLFGSTTVNAAVISSTTICGLSRGALTLDNFSVVASNGIPIICILPSTVAKIGFQIGAQPSKRISRFSRQFENLPDGEVGFAAGNRMPRVVRTIPTTSTGTASNNNFIESCTHQMFP